jgi:lysophospholipase L1-like esterase
MRTILVYLLFVASLFADSFELKEGETFLFLGDSITHKGFYTSYVETYFVTCYPERKLKFINAGISGDKAKDALDRFEEDVAIHKPNYVSIMLGMNDGGYKDFDQEIFKVYKNDMAEVLKSIQKLNATAIVITPTNFDQQQYTRRTAEPDFRFNRLKASNHYNATMAFFGAWMREEAMKHQLPFINFWGPLNDLTVSQRESEPEFTFNQDSIHPEAPGHAIMAASFITDLSVDRKAVSALNATYLKGEWKLKAKNGHVSNIQGNPETLSFDFKAGSLPWVLPEEAALGYALTKSGHKLSNERLSISGLSPGSYRISINGQDLGKKFSHLQLEKKIELQENKLTPQYQQAAQVAILIQQKFHESIVPYRNLQAKMKGQRRKHGIDAPQVKEFRLKLQPQLDELMKKSSELDREIRKAAQPQNLRYLIQKVDK